MTPDIFLAFLALLLIVAFLYASVGHGGASGYLAMMALFSFDPGVMRLTVERARAHGVACTHTQTHRGTQSLVANTHTLM